MKKKIVLILGTALLFGNLQLAAQWFTNGCCIVYTGDNVGIGTAAPSRKLQVQNGDIRISRSAQVPRYFEFVSTYTNQNDVRLEHSSSGGSLYFSRSTNNFAGFFDIARFDLLTSPSYVFTIYGSGLASGGFWINSDQKLKKDITDYSSAADIIKQLKPRTYMFKKDEYNNLNLPSFKQYGFVAQELEKILPDLVQTSQQPVRINANGEREMEDVKSVNYVGLIPILTKAMQEQQQTITALEERIAKLEAALTKAGSIIQNNAVAGKFPGAKLEQNTPNPFNQSTTIRYKIPAGANAQITLYDQSGKLMKTLKASDNGVSQINANTLSPGTYTYALSINGKLIESKQMMIVK